MAIAFGTDVSGSMAIHHGQFSVTPPPSTAQS